MAAALLLVAILGCTTGGLARTVSTTEIGYSVAEDGGESPLSADPVSPLAGRTAVWVSIRPLASLEPPTATYSVDPPTEESWGLQWPVATEELLESPEGGGTPWWYLALVPVLGGGGYAGREGWRRWRSSGDRARIRERLEDSDDQPVC